MPGGAGGYQEDTTASSTTGWAHPWFGAAPRDAVQHPHLPPELKVRCALELSTDRRKLLLSTSCARLVDMEDELL